MIVWDIDVRLKETIKVKPSAHWGSVMHGLLMEQLPADWQESLHSNGLRPFSQWVGHPDAQGFVWHVCAYDDGLADVMGNVLVEGAEFHSKHLNCDLTLAKVERTELTIQQYMKEIFTRETAPYRLQLRFRTTTSHKVQGQYMMFPEVSLIANSLRKHIMTLDPDCVIGDDQVFEDILNHVRLVKYELQSCGYDLEGARIFGYRGMIVLSVKGPDAIRRLAHMLFGFAPYCGVGIKTALGMGGCEMEIIERNEK